MTVNTRGHDVYADLRRHNGNNIEWKSIGGGFETFEDCVLDIQAWVDFLMKQGVKKLFFRDTAWELKKSCTFNIKQKSYSGRPNSYHLKMMRDICWLRIEKKI